MRCDRHAVEPIQLASLAHRRLFLFLLLVLLFLEDVVGRQDLRFSPVSRGHGRSSRIREAFSFGQRVVDHTVAFTHRITALRIPRCLGLLAFDLERC
jgi:hypothetical protein